MCINFRKQWKRLEKKVPEYEMVGESEKRTKIKPTINVLHNSPESETGAMTTKPFIDDVHDRSENEKVTEAKLSVKNALYEKGICTLVSSLRLGRSYSYMYIEHAS